MNNIKEHRVSQIQSKIDRLNADLTLKQSKLRIQVIDGQTYLDGKLVSVTTSVDNFDGWDDVKPEVKDHSLLTLMKLITTLLWRK
jgi:hypothetical protein